MENRGVAVHRTIVAVDIEGFGDRCRTNRNQVAIREGLYGAMREAFGQAGIPWDDRDHEDRGDGIFILAGPEVPKSVFVESLPSALVSALCLHNGTHPGPERMPAADGPARRRGQLRRARSHRRVDQPGVPPP